MQPLASPRPQLPDLRTPDALAALRAGHLALATRLDLRGCGLRELPPEVLALAETLEALDLSGNRLAALPEAFARLHKLRVLFCSDNAFTELPAVLGRCAALDIVGFKANRIERVAAQALPPALRWLILTDNRIAELPESLGTCPRLQKLMLAGNRLRRLPRRIGDCQRLELVRLAANDFERAEDALPEALLALPRLAWLGHAGNPFSQAREHAAEQAAVAGQTAAAPAATAAIAATAPPIAWSRLVLQGLLGEGASGVIHAATWQPATGAAQPVAVKLFKGAMTSDGLPRSEMAASIAAGAHPNIVAVEGRLTGHPDGAQGLVLRRIPPNFRNLAGPPSLASCTRDVYACDARFSASQAGAIASAMSSALAHLHRQGLVHGDRYAHNILVDHAGASLLGDFGAASFVPADDRPRAEALQRIDRRALGWLIDELAQRCDEPDALAALNRATAAGATAPWPG